MLESETREGLFFASMFSVNLKGMTVYKYAVVMLPPRISWEESGSCQDLFRSLESCPGCLNLAGLERPTLNGEGTISWSGFRTV